MNQRDKLILFAIVAGGIIFYLTRPTKTPTQQTTTSQTSSQQTTTSQTSSSSSPQTGGTLLTLYNPSHYLVKIQQLGQTLASIQPGTQETFEIYMGTPLEIYACQTSYACSLCQTVTHSVDLTLDASTIEQCVATAPPDFSQTFPVTIENTCNTRLAIIVQNLAGYGPGAKGYTSYETYYVDANSQITIQAPNFSTINVVNPSDFSEVYQNLPVNGEGGTLRVWNCPAGSSSSSTGSSSGSSSQQCYFTVWGPYGETVQIQFNGSTYTVPAYAPLNINVGGPGTYTITYKGKAYSVNVERTFYACYGSISL